jgi:ATP/maltotriose-dependent transcriptional regulator MalT
MGRLYQQALALAQRVGDDAMVIINLSHLAHELGDVANARSHYREALRIASHSGNRMLVLWSILNLAHLSIESGDAQKGVRLMGAYDALHERVEVDTQGASESGLLAAAREELGNDVFQTAWEAGRLMSEKEAIAAALEE